MVCLPCGHIFHPECIKENLDTSFWARTCPVCCGPIDYDQHDPFNMHRARSVSCSLDDDPDDPDDDHPLPLADRVWGVVKAAVSMCGAVTDSLRRELSGNPPKTYDLAWKDTEKKSAVSTGSPGLGQPNSSLKASTNQEDSPHNAVEVLQEVVNNTPLLRFVFLSAVHKPVGKPMSCHQPSVVDRCQCVLCKRLRNVRHFLQHHQASTAVASRHPGSASILRLAP